ncbi:Xaa-Pro peptidase family protein [Ammoniphilus sp. YIM 78166]|uniref:M24 family metallopeptidase n=1 Tax=Ammoniphilus sp. YIM 78166 TaxID=1644106 RepID=UPI00106F3240|nr:Xaa-Pro peptidase family protein [Ammoniphilus sp. YIM 78166]
MKERLIELRRRMEENELDSLIITSPYNRRYMSGFTGSAGYLLITNEHALLITDFRYIDQANEQAPDWSVIRHVASIVDEVGTQLAKLGAKKVGFEKQFVSFSLYESLKASHDQAEWIGIQGMVEEFRMVKTADEIAIIKEACEIADRTFQHILGFIRPGVSELEVSLVLEFHMRKLGAKSSSFDIIVASGERGALPHGVASDKIIQQGELVTLDFGAYYKGYVSDLTRTVAVGEPSDQLRKIYDTVLQAQLAGVNGIKAGMTGKEADALTRSVISGAGFGEYFGHSTGHGIGLEVHEGPGLSSKSDVVLKPGMVVTVEPGIYVSQLGGVRIEDDIIITENGCEIITHSTKELVIL